MLIQEIIKCVRENNLQKLKGNVIDKLVESRATGAEINFVLYISHYQDNTGMVRGVYYKTACAGALFDSHNTFYAVKNDLEKKGIIKATQNFYGDWDIKILDNDFSWQEQGPGHNMDNYIDTGISVFREEEFLKLKAREKLLAMICIKIASVGSPNYRIGTEGFYNKYTKLFGVKKRALQNYLTSLRKYFAIGIKNGQYWISPLRKKVQKEYTGKVTDKEHRAQHIAERLCRRNKLDNKKRTYIDLKELIKQYYYALGDRETESLLERAINICLSQKNGNINPKRWKNRLLNIKFIHKIFGELKEAYAN